MAVLTITTFLSLDGVMQAPGGPQEDPSGGFVHGGWMFPYVDSVFNQIVAENFARADAFLLGRKTYDIFADYWPKVTDPNDPIASKLNGLPKFVASKTKNTFEWKGTAGIRDVVEEVPALKKRFDREIQVHGSGKLAQALIQNDLIDEYRLFVIPILLGIGKRLFDEGVVPCAYTLARSQTSSKGVIYSVYRRGGKVQTGSFG